MADADLAIEDRWLKKYSMPIAVWFQGVHDTVGVLGVPFGDIPMISRKNYGYLETDLRINDSRAFHAIAIDEHREAFAPTLWRKTVTAGKQAYPDRALTDVEQRWFVSAHADVGGGYPNGLLAQLPLQWLMGKARLHGLEFRSMPTLDAEEKKAEIHDSFAQMAGGFYRLYKMFQPYYRPISAAPVVLGAQMTTTINESIDASVFDRWRSDDKYRP